MSEPAPADRLPWKSIITSMLILAVVYACRGWLLAWLVEGSYHWSVLLIDCAVLALLILVLRLVDFGVGKLARRWVGTQTRTRRVTATIVQFVVVFAIAAPFCIALVQFHPQKIGCGVTPAAVGLAYEDVALDADGLRLAAWHVPASAPGRPVVVICHGLGANKQNFLPAVLLMHDLDYHVLIFDFRGHGDSDGRRFTFGIDECRDVRAACARAHALHPDSKVFGLGYSVGGAALLKAAATDGGFDKVVIDSSFARAETVALHAMLWYLGPLKVPTWQVGRFWGWVFSGSDINDHNPETYISALRCPVLLVHGSADEMIPPAESLRLQEAAAPGTDLWIVEGLGHLQTMGDPDYQQRLRRFFGD